MIKPTATLFIVEGGDATLPKVIEGELAVIFHICNDVGAWGRGFVVPLGQRYPVAKQAYQQQHPKLLGTCSYASITADLVIVNAIGQHELKANRLTKEPPIRYDAVEQAMLKSMAAIKQVFGDRKFSYHMPKIGCGLAGGQWTIIKELIIKNIVNDGIDVYVYVPTN